MVDDVDRVFGALADPTRRAMLRLLARGERTVSELAAGHPISLAAASKHVGVLERAGLLRRRVEGRRHVCRLATEPLAAAAEHLRGYLTGADAAPNPAPQAEAPQQSVTARRVLPAPPGAVYAAWTEPALLRRWFGNTVDADVRVGGAYRITNHDGDGVPYAHAGRYVALEPPGRLAFTFSPDPPEPGAPDDRETVTAAFAAARGGLTELAVVHSWSGPPALREELADLRAGWEEWLDRLAGALGA